jgi:hypothetical protein
MAIKRSDLPISLLTLAIDERKALSSNFVLHSEHVELSCRSPLSNLLHSSDSIRREKAYRSWTSFRHPHRDTQVCYHPSSLSFPLPQSDIHSTALRVCHVILSPTESFNFSAAGGGGGGASYLNSLLFLSPSEQLISKQLLCKTLAILCFECLCQLVMSFPFHSEIHTSFTKPSIESLGSKYLAPQIPFEVT